MIAPLVFGLAGVAVLVQLGTWQLRRLEWKNALIADISARMEAAPVPIPQAPTPEADRYLSVRTSGDIQPGEVDIYTSAPPRGVGYRVIVPLALADGRTILLDRGFVPITEKDNSRRLGPITVEGNLDWPRESDSFTAAPDLAKNVWFARDVPAMAAALRTEPVLLVTAASDDTTAPQPLPVTVNLPNDHLGYAVTWFGLAAVWAGMTLYMLWRIKRRTA